jgi:phosphate starvation-inducible protein PhoH
MITTNNAKAVITGGVTLADLPLNKNSGLIQAQAIVKKRDGIQSFCITAKDVVRSGSLGKIVKAYEKKQQAAT